MLNIPVALVSSLGEAGLKIFNPTAREEETGNFRELALLGQEAEVHFHSLEPASDTVTDICRLQITDCIQWISDHGL